MTPPTPSAQEPDYLFWAKRWKDARSIIRPTRMPYRGLPDLAESNYALYLAEVFSWMFETRKAVKGDSNHVGN